MEEIVQWRVTKGPVNYNLIKAIWNHNLSIFITKNTAKPMLPPIMAGNASVPGLKMKSLWRYMNSSSSKSAGNGYKMAYAFPTAQGAFFFMSLYWMVFTCLQAWMPFIYLSTSQHAIHLSSCQHPMGLFICKPNYLSPLHFRVLFTCHAKVSVTCLNKVSISQMSFFTLVCVLQAALPVGLS